MSTHNIYHDQYKKKITRNIPKYNNVCSYDNFCQGLNNEFEIAQVNEPSVFEPLKFYCIIQTRKNCRRSYEDKVPTPYTRV